jgi:light-regulated signal transduction histidine kinase (bacteriophytochrome)
LEQTNQKLQRELAERQRAEEEVRMLNTDLDQRVKERTAELEVANKELEAFSYSVSHDLRAPLRRMRGFSTILLEEHAPQLTDEAQQLLQVVNRNAVQMGELIDCILAFSQLGRQPLRKQKVAAADVVRVAWQDLSAERDGREVEITICDLPVCEADPLLLKQIFINLLSNAIKYSRIREVANIEVGCKKSGVYYVRDNGVGFDMRYLDKLFGVFKRLHRTEEYEGIGIGLAIVARIVYRHGGRVWAEAVLNEGATFYFTLA